MLSLTVNLQPRTEYFEWLLFIYDMLNNSHIVNRVNCSEMRHFYSAQYVIQTICSLNLY